MQSLADFDRSLQGGALPAAAEAALREASDQHADALRVALALQRAQQHAPEHPAVLIALYRDHFYAHRWAAARQVARRALVVGAAALGLPIAWREVPARALPGARHDATTRFYLFALKGMAYLDLRLGRLRDAGDALALLRALDPDDRVGGALLEGVRQAALRAVADDDEAAPPTATGAAAWAQAGAAR